MATSDTVTKTTSTMSINNGGTTPLKSHRLPTFSASQALLDLDTNTPQSGPARTGIKAIDGLLGVGFEPGKVTELWGPCGSGKSTVALQACRHIIGNEGAVVWLECASPVSGSRIESLLSPKDLERLTFINAPTLSHLLFLILHPTPSSLPKGTRLLVLDDLNMLVDLDYPRSVTFSSNKSEAQKWQSTRRYSILGSIVNALNKLAVLNRMAVIVTTGCASRMRSDFGLGAVLVPGVGGSEWDAGIWTRIVTLRDFNGRFMGLQKSRGANVGGGDGGMGSVASFIIMPDGTLDEAEGEQSTVQSSSARNILLSPAKSRKRAYEEIADSDGDEPDDYGWVELDESVETLLGGNDGAAKAAVVEPMAILEKLPVAAD